VDVRLPRLLSNAALPSRLLVATAREDVYALLEEEDLAPVQLPLKAADKYSQVRHAFSVALRLEHVAVGELVLCAVGAQVYPDEGDLIVLADMEAGAEQEVITDLLKITDNVRPSVLEATLTVGSKIGRVVRRGGDRIGAIFMLGHSAQVLEGAKQMVPNPFYGHDEPSRQITNPQIHDALVEFAKLDGAFVIRGDGYIEAAGVFLATDEGEIDLPAGLGARHTAAAASSAHTGATAVVVSATDGNVRVFDNGRQILQMAPNLPYGPIDLQEEA
jgi:DNA integrity scanning protein DisA with diadenylate cyclase activity